MAETLVLAYGNPLCSDDGVAWEVACEFTRTLDDAAVEVKCCQELTPELAVQIARADQVIFVDASVDLPPGIVGEQKIEAADNQNPFFSHHLAPAALLGSAQELYGHVPEAWLLSVGVKSVDPGEELSADVRAAIPEVLDRIEALISRFRKARLESLHIA